MQHIGRPNRGLLSEQALGRIRHAIVTGELQPGEAVKDIDLASRLGLSRTPVREALARLTDEGLIETKPQSYTRVTPLDAQTVRDALEVVQSMQGLATRLAVPKLTDEQLGALRTANQDFTAAVESGSVDDAMRWDDAFHDILVRASGNRAVAATIYRYHVTETIHWRGDRPTPRHPVDGGTLTLRDECR
ncbi:GntR family transcriptional regulator, partial [Streptosporangium sp. NPDC048865]|uniref:GntR family transcriptional regulator n=1 Tax=Streptosporangium sp. NPDC048865 TaxID=3155766 RepID=UPI0034216412